MIGAYIRELAEIVKTTKYKEEGKKLIYGILPAVQIAYTGYKYAGGDNVYVSFPDLLLVDILNGFSTRLRLGLTTPRILALLMAVATVR